VVPAFAACTSIGDTTNLHLMLLAIQESGAEASVAIRDEWEAGWRVRMDEAFEPIAPNLEYAAEWLHEQALENYPLSKYARNLAIMERFRPRGKYRRKTVGRALQRLYNSVDRVGISSAPGKGWDVRFTQTFQRVASLDEAVSWLNQQQPTDEDSME
jgi:hypothetical protein